VPAIAVTSIIFLSWDTWFSFRGVWSFSEHYTLGPRFASLPAEEWLFFLCVPYACVFIYEVCRVYIGGFFLFRLGIYVAMALSVLLLLLGAIYFQRIYTAVNFISCGIMLFIQSFVLRRKYLGLFFIAYLIQLIPFLLVNGILTGSFIYGEVVRYSDAETLGMRIFTIPVEDTVYSMLLLLLPVSIMEYLRSNKQTVSVVDTPAEL
jgi:lycopene cyclase domain-containing protein